MKLLILALLVFGAISDLYIYRQDFLNVSRRSVRISVILADLLLWGLFIAGLILHFGCGGLSGTIYKAFEIYLVVFAFVTSAKILYALLLWIGRRLNRARSFRIAAFSLIALAAAIFIYSTTAGISSVRIERVEVCSDKITDAIDGFRIAVFSDVHLGSILHEEKLLRRLVEAINSVDADIVVQCGDLVNISYDQLTASVMEILSGIQNRQGVYSVLGNHDIGYYIHDTAGLAPGNSIRQLVERQQQMGWTVLSGQTVFLPVGADTISITGIEYPDELYDRSHAPLMEKYDYTRLYEDVPGGQFNITVSHAPQPLVGMLSDGRADLMIAGHLHSMQAKISIGGWQWSPARFLSPYWSGLYVENGKYLYINDGVGYAMLPMRFGTRPEVTLITLRKQV